MRTASLFHHTAYTIDTTDTTDTADATDTVDTANQSGRFTTDRRAALPSSVGLTRGGNFQSFRRVMLHNTFACDVRSHFEVDCKMKLNN